MLGIFESIKDYIKLKPQTLCIDNWIFRLHYRATTLIFIIATILVTSRQYIGEHIKCINDMGSSNLQKVIETYCFFTSTFTVVNDHDPDLIRYGYIAHPGVGAYGINSPKLIKKHLYYQWVPFVLFSQAIMFYLTHLLWKKFEGRRIQKLVESLNFTQYSLLDKEVQIDNNIIPSKEIRDQRILQIKTDFINRIILNKSWSHCLVFFEILNVLNVVLQIYITDLFLGGQFYHLGPNLIRTGSKLLDEIFPKVTKCTFYKYGHSGSIQNHDALCIMALNIINEKIYVFLWLWFAFLFAMSFSAVFWRFTSILFYSKSSILNQVVFNKILDDKKIYPWHLQIVTKHCKYNDWLLLSYLSQNIDSLVFRELFINLSDEIEERKPLFSTREKGKTV